MDWKNPKSWLFPRGPEAERLAEIVGEVRRTEFEDGSPGLSDAARTRILAEAVRPEAARPFWAPLFAPTSRLLVAGGLPLALAAALLVLVDRSVVEPPVDGVAAPRTAVVTVAKVGNSVQFTIANGQNSHYVYRSTAPDRFETDEGVAVVDGSYADRLEDGSALVFYRID